MRQVLDLTASHLLWSYRGCVYLTQPCYSLKTNKLLDSPDLSNNCWIVDLSL